MKRAQVAEFFSVQSKEAGKCKFRQKFSEKTDKITNSNVSHLFNKGRHVIDIPVDDKPELLFRVAPGNIGFG